MPQDDALPVFPFRRTKPFDLPREYKAEQGECPVKPVKLWNGERAWVLTKHTDFCAVLLDPRFSGEFARPDFPAVTRARQQIDKAEGSFVAMDNPRHDHYRRMLLKEFTTKKMLALRPAIEKITDQLLDDIEQKGPPVDLVSQLAVELPALVMCEMIGSPYEDHTFISKCASGRHGLTQTTEEALKTASDLVDYCRRLIRQKQTNPGDDMVSRVAQAHIATGELSVDEFAHMCALILRAGHDTTTHMIGMGTLLFLRYPDQLERLKADPALINPAVEELLRYISPVQFAPRRVALEDVEVDGALIRKGEGVFASTPAVNRDPEEFPNPDKFDIGRDASTHMAFGYGIHRCLGQGLARIELQVVFPKLFARFPALKLAEPFEQISFRYNFQIFGVDRLMLEW